MIVELEKDNFTSLYHLLDAPMHNIEVKAVITGNSPGWIFADSAESPRTAMIWSKGIQGFYFIGDENNPEFNNHISGFIDTKFLNDKTIENMEFVTSEILRWWYSCEDYLDKTFGYCIMSGKKIVTYCLCGSVCDAIHTIGIETLPGFRRNGLAQVTAEAFIETCIKNQVYPQWECMESNRESRNLAEKLKFKRDYIYTLYSFPFKKEEDMKGESLYEKTGE